MPVNVLPEHLHNSAAKKYAKVLLEYQNQILELPVPPKQLYAQACSNDGITINSWRDIWLKNMRANKARFGNFKDHSVGKLYKQFQHMPCIIAGSGPSLTENIHQLKDRGSIPLISCLHNFHIMEDNDARPDYYVSLDAGEVVLEEVSEGGKESADAYWEKTKGKKLIAYIGTNPLLFEKWQGEIYLFNSPLPDQALMKEIETIERFGCWISNGGNVLGACLYLARGVFGCGTMAFVGADFSFSYDHKFHAWDSKYDEKLGYVIKAVDVYGNKRLTWQSYMNFKGWFEQLAVTSPQIFINCSEGGCFGSYPEGNLAAIQQMRLSRFLFMHRMHEELEEQMVRPELAEPKILF